jgi:SPP1 gp7 family putative phage head morphogenesis protein
MNDYYKSLLKNIPKKRLKGLLKKKPHVLKYPSAIENEYARAMKKMVTEWKNEVKNIIIPQLPHLYEIFHIAHPKIDSLEDDQKQLLELMKQGFSKSSQKVIDIINRISQQVSDKNSKEWINAVHSVLGIDAIYNEPWLAQQVESFKTQNVDLITNLSSVTQSKISTIVQQGFSQGIRVEEIMKQLIGSGLDKGVFGSIEARAELIARDQVGKLNGQLTRLRQQELGINIYIWQTSMDERVRPTHQAMQGKLCKYGDPTVYSDDNGKTWKDRSSADRKSVV